ncbi:MAG: TolC family outer membrane protein [Candidatus Competibacteraceae bacterium]
MKLFMVKYYRILSICWFASALCCPPALAADIMEAYRNAVDSDPQLRQAVANREAGQELKPQARALLLPNVSADAYERRVYNFNQKTPDAPPALRARPNSSYNNFQYEITVTQPIYNREADYRVRAAEASANRSDADLVFAQQDLVVRVATLYFNVLAALDNLTFRIADKSAIGRQLEQAKRRFEVGLITVTDVAEAQARYDLATADEIDARQTLADAREALREVTGRYYEQINVLDEKAPLDPVKPTDPDAWVKIALENNPQVQSAVYNAESSRENIEVQRSGHYPTLNLAARRYKTNAFDLNTDANQVGLELNVPLFAGGATSARTREAAYQHEAAKEQLEQVQRQVIRQVRNAYQGLETARSRVKALQQAVISNRSSLEATQAGFDVGTRTIVDVLNAERDLLSTIRELSTSRYQYITNRLQLLQAAGQITGPRQIEAINAWLRPPKEKQPQ